MISAEEALKRLKDGNERFATNNVQESAKFDSSLAGGQAPFAIILGCSDSRVPSEIVFDQGLGDLFIIRVAGNIAAPSQIGSIEYAAAHLGTPLVVVLGHSKCGAVAATVSELQAPQGGHSPHLKSIIDRISPAVQPVLENAGDAGESDLIELGVKANVEASTKNLLKESDILRNLLSEGKLTIVGAKYALETGRITFFEDN